ncbi:MAG: hypothetical protein AB7U29_04235 [Desulfobulbus sp.]
MITQFKDWYSLDEVAEMFECTVDDINHFIDARKIDFVVWLENEQGYVHDWNVKCRPAETRLFGLWYPIGPQKPGDGPIVYKIDADNPEKGLYEGFAHVVETRNDALELASEKKYPFIIYHSDYKKYLLANQVYTIGCNSKTAKKVILRTEFERFKSTMTNDSSGVISEILNKEHPWYSENLALAVNAWIALYSDHEGRKGDNAFKPYGGHKKMIASWLEDHFNKDTSPTARESIAAVVSPCKAPGQGSCPPWHAKVKKQP